MDKPSRHFTHVLENRSNKFLNAQLPEEWFLDKPDHDYGIDFTANIVINGQVTGLNFSIQLKSKKIENNESSAVISIKYRTLRLYNTRLEPVLLIAYVKAEDEAYYLWFDELKIDLTSKQKTLRINIPKTNKLSLIKWDELTAHVQKRFSIKTLVDGIKDLEYDEMSNAQIMAWNNYYCSKFENAAFYFKKTLYEEQNPDSEISLLEGLAHSLYMLYRYQEALETIDKAILLSGTSGQYLTKACILAEDGITNKNKARSLEAKKIFSSYIEQQDTVASHLFNYANSLRYLNEYEQAAAHYKKGLAIDPNHAEAWKNLGSCYYEFRDHEKEISCYDKALKLKPDLQEALFSKGATLSFVYNKNKEGLELMMQALDVGEKTMILNFPFGYFWIAQAYKKMGNTEQVLYFIDKGLNIDPENSTMLDFKTDFLALHWDDNEVLKSKARDFFSFRLELDGNYRCLYYLIKIQEAFDNKNVLEYLKKNLDILQKSTVETLSQSNVQLSEVLDFLIHYDKYRQFRNDIPQNRYTSHLVSPHFYPEKEFLEVLDLVAASSFSAAISVYENGGDLYAVASKILDCLLSLPDLITLLTIKENLSMQDKKEAVIILFREFPHAVIREFSGQLGYISGKLNLEPLNTDDILSGNWLDQLQEKVYNMALEKFKLK
ncbi:tetratricopeptide repeat protein [Flavobacterium sp. CF136]|uniref:tetratricopeptide repeat protein n=1 Tax=Flavobacterium sp. (strain CF136) TaxID=1144313 RepID=UPI000271525F|nr:tetratricopeptide repeat protein [Flavobacterium sp. CF136]EJL65241.1 tetratricopeptide repeat protein [Flavobacterium sp. CF136]